VTARILRSAALRARFLAHTPFARPVFYLPDRKERSSDWREDADGVIRLREQSDGKAGATCAADTICGQIKATARSRIATLSDLIQFPR